MLSHNLSYSDSVSKAVEFLVMMLSRTSHYHSTACLTLTAIHPDGKHRTPSRHIPLNQPDLMEDALQRLLQANQMGWGAHVAIGLRRKGLICYRWGGVFNIVALPTLFVDVIPEPILRFNCKPSNQNRPASRSQAVVIIPIGGCRKPLPMMKGVISGMHNLSNVVNDKSLQD